MPLFRAKKKLAEDYQVTGFISSGTYGRVYKAIQLKGEKRVVAIKKFKPEKEGAPAYTGISQSATREMMLCASLKHPNLIELVETHLEDKSIYMIFSYAEHDLLQMIHHHTSINATAANAHSPRSSDPPPRTPITVGVLRSVLYQLLSGLAFLHRNWILHRDLKPANIMVTAGGRIQIGDLGLARRFRDPPASLFAGDKVVVTIWYRAPELLLGARHYTPAVDLWAVGCIIGELLGLRPMFKGEEVKPDAHSAMSTRKGGVPFQKNQMGKIVEVMGLPMVKEWPGLQHHPDADRLPELFNPKQMGNFRPMTLEGWYRKVLWSGGYAAPEEGPPQSPGLDLLALMKELLTWDPVKRTTAEGAMNHDFFVGASWPDKPSDNCFEGCELTYPKRKVGQEGGVQHAVVNQAQARATLKRTHTGEDDPLGSKRYRPA